MKIDVTINAGQVLEYTEPGDFFRLLEAPDPVTVRFYFQGREVSQAPSVGEGYAERLRVGEFDRIQLESATTQAIQFVTRYGSDVFYDRPPTGAVTLQGEQSAFSQFAVTVGTTSISLAGPKENRRYMLVQNRNATGNIYLNVSGGTAFVGANSIKIEPGGSWEISGFAPTGQIFVIGDIASNPDVVIVQG